MDEASGEKIGYNLQECKQTAIQRKEDFFHLTILHINLKKKIC